MGFLYVKDYSFWSYLLPGRMGPRSAVLYGVEIIGLSYMLFKLIHMIVDQWQDQLSPYNLASYAGITSCHSSRFVAGPIQRFNDFQHFLGADRRRTCGCPALGSSRDGAAFSTGIIKMGILSPIFWHYFEVAGEGLKRRCRWM